MSELSKSEARRHLAELETIVDDLDGCGMDVRLMRATIATIKAELGEDDRAERIEAWLRGLPTTAVITYTVKYDDAGMAYNFAAVKVGAVWYTTASSHPRQLGSRQLARWMAGLTLIDCVRMTPGSSQSRPDVEMRQR